MKSVLDKINSKIKCKAKLTTAEKKRAKYKKTYVKLKREDVISKSEKVLYLTLKLALKDDYHIWPQFSMNQLVYTEGAQEKLRMGLWGTIKHMSLDYLIMSRDFDPIAAVELDDKTHDSWDARKKDEYKDLILAEIGIPMKRITVKNMPKADQAQELREFIINASK